jgi:hypothetical protein
MLFIFQGAFTIGFQATVWVYPSEILPLKARQKGSSISTAANWICNFIIVYITPPAIRNIGWRTYIIFGVLNAVWVPIIVSESRFGVNFHEIKTADSDWQYVFFPETKGMSYYSIYMALCELTLTFVIGLALEDVDRLFAPDEMVDAILDQKKQPDVETVEVRRGAWGVAERPAMGLL